MKVTTIKIGRLELIMWKFKFLWRSLTCKLIGHQSINVAKVQTKQGNYERWICRRCWMVTADFPLLVDTNKGYVRELTIVQPTMISKQPDEVQ